MFLIAQIIVSGLLIGIQLYFYKLVNRYFAQLDMPRIWNTLAIIFLVVFSLPLGAFLVYRPLLFQIPQWIINGYITPMYLWHFSFTLLFLVFMIGTSISFLTRMAKNIIKVSFPRGVIGTNKSHETALEESNPRRRIFIRKGAVALAGAVMTGSSYGAIRRNQFEHTTIDIPIHHLPEQFRGFHISFISDIHSSIFMTKDQMRRYVDAVNALQSDMTVVTGDFVNSMADEVYPFAEAFSEMRAPFGIYGVLGNHDFYTRRVETVATEVNNCGIRLLRNTNIAIEKGGNKIYLAGVDDVGSSTRAGQLFDQALSGTEPSIPRILMCHRPYFFQQATDRNVGLMLSGHTHGGQIVFGRTSNGVIAPARVISPYVAGLYRIQSSQMYVSRGIGTVGVPIRFNCPPEITTLILVAA